MEAPNETLEPTDARKFGARIYFYDDGVVLVKQTVQRTAGGPYVIDSQKEKHVDPGDDQALADAVRAAGRGEL